MTQDAKPWTFTLTGVAWSTGRFAWHSPGDYEGADPVVHESVTHYVKFSGVLQRDGLRPVPIVELDVETLTDVLARLGVTGDWRGDLDIWLERAQVTARGAS